MVMSGRCPSQDVRFVSSHTDCDTCISYHSCSSARATWPLAYGITAASSEIARCWALCVWRHVRTARNSAIVYT